MLRVSLTCAWVLMLHVGFVHARGSQEQGLKNISGDRVYSQVATKAVLCFNKLVPENVALDFVKLATFIRKPLSALIRNGSNFALPLDHVRTGQQCRIEQPSE